MVIQKAPPQKPIRRRAKPRASKGSGGLHLECILSSNEETRFKKSHQNLFLRLIREVHFDYNEIESISLIYYKFQLKNKTKKNPNPNMTQYQFIDILHNGFDMTHGRLKDLTASAVQVPNPKGVSGFSLESWIKTLSLFLRGTLEEQIFHCYKIYDFYKQNFLRKDFLVGLLENSFILDGGDSAEEIVREMLDIVLKKMDVDRDTKVSFEDYRTSVLKNPLLLESFGQCLPSRYKVAAFVRTFTNNLGKL